MMTLTDDDIDTDNDDEIDENDADIDENDDINNENDIGDRIMMIWTMTMINDVAVDDDLLKVQPLLFALMIFTDSHTTILEMLLHLKTSINLFFTYDHYFYSFIDIF